ncbi:unnamed protein product [Candida verbasci]|uniref:Ubiquitin-like domain-containing protein n=1 Tax=Candida verbasci TaxID=1227364 RepID=A0A9W4TZK3_9ASCO|nr:unnamed protein product [Candida verbasci]
MSVITTERQFVNTYIELISLSNKQSSIDIDYNKLQSLGPSLPKYNYKFPPSTANNGESSYLLKFKSIKPPFKFTTELKITSNESIYKIKSLLIDQLNLKKEGISPNDIKFLIKSKVVNDSINIDSLGLGSNEILINCMITPSTKPIEEDQDQDPDISEPLTISEDSWNKIYEIIQYNIKDVNKSKELIEKFKLQI